MRRETGLRCGLQLHPCGNNRAPSRGRGEGSGALSTATPARREGPRVRLHVPASRVPSPESQRGTQGRRTWEEWGPHLHSPPLPRDSRLCSGVPLHSVVGRKQSRAPPSPAGGWPLISLLWKVKSLLPITVESGNFCASDISSCPGVNQPSAVPAGARVWGTRLWCPRKLFLIANYCPLELMVALNHCTLI